MSWVSVKDRLPEFKHDHESGVWKISDTVMVSDLNSHPSIGFGHMGSDGGWRVYCGEYDFMNVESVTHWMPLPKPPKDEL